MNFRLTDRSDNWSLARYLSPPIFRTEIDLLTGTASPHGLSLASPPLPLGETYSGENVLVQVLPLLIPTEARPRWTLSGAFLGAAFNRGLSVFNYMRRRLLFLQNLCLQHPALT